MSKIIINNCVYKIHPSYDLYATSKNGQIIHIIKRIPSSGNLHNTGYIQLRVRRYAQKGQNVITFIDLFGNVITDLSQIIKLLIIPMKSKMIINYAISN